MPTQQHSSYRKWFNLKYINMKYEKSYLVTIGDFKTREEAKAFAEEARWFIKKDIDYDIEKIDLWTSKSTTSQD